MAACIARPAIYGTRPPCTAGGGPICLVRCRAVELREGLLYSGENALDAIRHLRRGYGRVSCRAAFVPDIHSISRST